jgi:hypothetical protein
VAVSNIFGVCRRAAFSLQVSLFDTEVKQAAHDTRWARPKGIFRQMQMAACPDSKARTWREEVGKPGKCTTKGEQGRLTGSLTSAHFQDVSLPALVANDAIWVLLTVHTLHTPTHKGRFRGQ